MVCTGFTTLPSSCYFLLLTEWGDSQLWIIYFEKIRVFKAGLFCALNITAWDNRIGFYAYFVGF